MATWQRRVGEEVTDHGRDAVGQTGAGDSLGGRPRGRNGERHGYLILGGTKRARATFLWEADVVPLVFR